MHKRRDRVQCRGRWTKNKPTFENVKKLIFNGMRANIAWIWHNFYNAVIYLSRSFVECLVLPLEIVKAFFFHSLKTTKAWKMYMNTRSPSFFFFSIHLLSLFFFSLVFIGFTVFVYLYLILLLNMKWALNGIFIQSK